jgi:hypothetical protein
MRRRIRRRDLDTSRPITDYREGTLPTSTFRASWPDVEGRSNYSVRMKLFGRGRMPLDDDTGIVRGEALIVDLQGKPVKAYAGETVAAVVVAADGLATRTTVSGERRGIFCGMGVCFDCLVVVNGVPNTRSCMTLVTNGMKIQYQERAGLDH